MIENSMKSQFLINKTVNDKSLIKETFLSTTQDAFNEALNVNIFLKKRLQIILIMDNR